MATKKKTVATRSAKSASVEKKHKVIEPIPDTPENVAKSLFGIKTTGKKKSSTKK